MADAYAFATKSSLKLKGGSDPTIKKKKKKKDKEREREKAVLELNKVSDEAESSKTADDDLFRGKKPIEIAWLRKKREKEMTKIQKKAELYHKKKVEKFNEGLNKLSEHYDIPKVSWTK